MSQEDLNSYYFDRDDIIDDEVGSDERLELNRNQQDQQLNQQNEEHLYQNQSEESEQIDSFHQYNSNNLCQQVFDECGHQCGQPSHQIRHIKENCPTCKEQQRNNMCQQVFDQCGHYCGQPSHQIRHIKENCPTCKEQQRDNMCQQVFDECGHYCGQPSHQIRHIKKNCPTCKEQQRDNMCQQVFDECGHYCGQPSHQIRHIKKNCPTCKEQQRKNNYCQQVFDQCGHYCGQKNHQIRHIKENCPTCKNQQKNNNICKQIFDDCGHFCGQQIHQIRHIKENCPICKDQQIKNILRPRQQWQESDHQDNLNYKTNREAKKQKDQNQKNENNKFSTNRHSSKDVGQIIDNKRKNSKNKRDPDRNQNKYRQISVDMNTNISPRNQINSPPEGQNANFQEIRRCNQTLPCGHKCKSDSIDNCPMDFHDICEIKENQQGRYYCMKDDVSIKLNLEQINQILLKLNQQYKCQVLSEQINLELRREIEIEIFIFKKLFEGKLNQINFKPEDQKCKMKLLRYIQRTDLYYLLGKNQFIFIRNLVVKFIVKDINLKEPQLFLQINLSDLSEQQVYKILRYFQGFEICNQVLDCSHSCKQGFHLTQCECLQTINYTKKCQHTETIYCKDQQKALSEDQNCKSICNKTISGCTHKCQQICRNHLYCECKEVIEHKFRDCQHSLQGFCKDKATFICQKYVYKQFSNCDHKKQVKCSEINKVIKCQEIIVQKYQDCSHSLNIQCSKRQQYQQCNVAVNLCVHRKDVPCHLKNKPCQQICNKNQDCGHQCTKVCHDTKCVCDLRIKYKFRCGHISSVKCLDQLTAQCNQLCNKKLKCGHQCQLKCTEPCQCNQLVEHKFQCGHKATIKCSDEKSGLVCRAMKQITFDCKHKETKYCFEEFSKQCNKPCLKKLNCSHDCIKNCSQSCECGNEINKMLICGHQIKICSKLQNSPYICQINQTYKRECGHLIETECQYLNQRLLRQCQEKCKKQLQCMHYCEDICSNKCLAHCKKCQQDQLNQNQLLQSTIQSNSQTIQQNPPMNEQNESKTKLIEQCGLTLKCNHKCRQLKQEDCYCSQLVNYKCFICSKITVIECQQSTTYICQQKVSKQCKFCQQKQLIGCGEYIKCSCMQSAQINTVFDKDIEISICKTILSCNHQCNGTYCTTLHEMCAFSDTCEHNQPIFCSGRTSCQECIQKIKHIRGIKLKQIIDEQGYNNDNFLQFVSQQIFDDLTFDIIYKLIPIWIQIKQLPILSNQQYERNRILLKVLMQDNYLSFKAQLHDIEAIQTKLHNLMEYEKQQRKCCTNIFKYSKLKSIENSRIYDNKQNLYVSFFKLKYFVLQFILIFLVLNYSRTIQPFHRFYLLRCFESLHFLSLYLLEQQLVFKQNIKLQYLKFKQLECILNCIPSDNRSNFNSDIYYYFYAFCQSWESYSLLWFDSIIHSISRSDNTDFRILYDIQKILLVSPITCVDLRRDSLGFGFVLSIQSIFIMQISILYRFAPLLHSFLSSKHVQYCIKFVNYSCILVEILFICFMINDLTKDEECGSLRILVFVFLITIMAVSSIGIIYLIVQWFINRRDQNEQN
ncbi:hypothetical protein pb186bvf_017954 [Paramecium bursaria]